MLPIEEPDILVPLLVSLHFSISYALSSKYEVVSSTGRILLFILNIMAL